MKLSLGGDSVLSLCFSSNQSAWIEGTRGRNLKPEECKVEQCSQQSVFSLVEETVLEDTPAERKERRMWTPVEDMNSDSREFVGHNIKCHFPKDKKILIGRVQSSKNIKCSSGDRHITRNTPLGGQLGEPELQVGCSNSGRSGGGRRHDGGAVTIMAMEKSRAASEGG
ncbi:hypothetical protein YC2023_017500 [Brassica napus]